MKAEIVRAPKNLKYEDITDELDQYRKKSIKEVLREAPEGIACVWWTGDEYQWVVGPIADYPKMFERPWKGICRTRAAR